MLYIHYFWFYISSFLQAHMQYTAPAKSQHYKFINDCALIDHLRVSCQIPSPGDPYFKTP